MNPRLTFKTHRYLIWGISLISLLLASPVSSFQVPADDSCYVYPNPVHPNPTNNYAAWVVYNMPSSGTALVSIYNESGDLVAQVQENKPAGPQQQTGLNLFYYLRGLYFCQVSITLDNGETRLLKVFKFVVIQ